MTNFRIYLGLGLDSAGEIGGFLHVGTRQAR